MGKQTNSTPPKETAKGGSSSKGGKKMGGKY